MMPKSVYKNVRRYAVAATVMGAIMLLTIATIYVVFSSRLDLLAQQGASQATVFELVRAFRAFSFGVCPGLALFLMGCGIGILSHLRKFDNMELTA